MDSSKTLLIKRLTLVPLLLLFVHTHAQVDFGLKGGLNFPTYSYGDKIAASKAKSITSFYVAGYMNIPLATNFHLHPELSLQGKGAKIIKTDAVDGSNEITQRINWIQIPVNLAVKLPINNTANIFAGAGPYIGVSMNGENTYGDGSTSAVIIYKDNAIKSIDYGANFLAGFKFGAFSLNAAYSLGLANVTYNTNKWAKDIKNRVLSLGVGVSFASLHK